MVRDLQEGDTFQLGTWAMDPDLVDIWPDLARQVSTLESALKGDTSSAGLCPFALIGPEKRMIGFFVLTGIDWGYRTARLELVLSDKGWWSRESCARALAAVLSVCFDELALARLIALASPVAPWLIGGFELSGFRRTGFASGSYHTKGRVWRMVQLSLRREEFELFRKLRGGF